ncbi:MAG TPA: hypothetical protein VFQ95_05725 [Rhodanobacteraceae bacterium]|nr:hypothetical protein [Rhodanobacteraceae bacterium]
MKPVVAGSARSVRTHLRLDPAVDGFFDYRLRPGPATARNAIRLLAEVGFPAAIVDAATAYVEAGARGGKVEA